MKDINIDQYEKNADAFFETTVLANMQSLYESFLSLVEPRGKILDRGCRSGRDCKYFIGKGYQVEAIDGSPTLCRLASDYIGQKVVCSRMEDISYKEEFDGIWDCVSLLHIKKNDMLNMLQKMKKALRKNGVLYLSFKEGRGQKIKNGRLFNYYDEDELQKVKKI